MAIETKDLVIYKSERLTDNSDGGGKYSGVVVQDGISNNLFNDVSEMDRTMGDVSMRKVFPAVTTEDTDLLMGATVFVSELPEDPNVSALLFSTKNWWLNLTVNCRLSCGCSNCSLKFSPCSLDHSKTVRSSRNLIQPICGSAGCKVIGRPDFFLPS